MSGARGRRLIALVLSGLVAGLVLLIGPAVPTAAGPIDCTLDPDAPECTTTTSVEDTSTSIDDTSTSTVVDDTSTTVEETSTTAEAPAPTDVEVIVTTTSTTIDVSTSADVLVPGDGTEGAESTTTTTAAPAATVTDGGGTSDGTLLALIVGGLLVLAVAVAVLTWRYWVATRPPLVSTVGSSDG